MTSGKRTKVDRSVARLREALAQIHDRLHKGDIENAHELCHQALGSGYVNPGDVAPLTERSFTTFDDEFRHLCMRTGLKAAFVVATPHDDGKGARILTGGDAELDKFVNIALRATSGVTEHPVPL